MLVALDSGGKQMSSEELAEFLRQHMERGTQELVLAIGPADGWSGGGTGAGADDTVTGKDHAAA